MRTIHAKTFHGETVALDECRFISCTMIDCTLHYTGGTVVFEHTRFRRCRYLFFGAARNTVHFLQQTGLMPFVDKEWGEMEAGEPGQSSQTSN